MQARRARPDSWLLGLVMVAVSCPVDVAAYDFEVSARTEAYGYQLRRYDRAGLTFLNRRRVTQHLGLRIFNLLEDGRLLYGARPGAPPALLQLNVQLRFFTDFGAYVRPLTERPELRNDRFELLWGAVEGRNLWGVLDLSLGRQYEAELFDFFGYDGLRVRLHSPWHLYLEGHFGARVDRADPLSVTVFETDGVSGEAADQGVASTFGVAVGVEDLTGFDLKVAYRTTRSRGDSATTAAGRVWGTDEELVFARLGYRLPVVQTLLLGGLRYNLLLAGFDEVQGLLLQPIGERHLVQLEGLRSVPHFDGDSIFNIFAIEPYSEVALRYSLRLAPLTLESRLGYRWFWHDKRDAAGATAFSSGFAARWLGSGRRADFELFYLSGPTGRRVGGDLDGRWRLWRRLILDGRVSLAITDDDLRPSPTLTNLGLQLGAEIIFVRQVRLLLSVEDNISRIYDSALRLLAVLDMEFAP